MRITPLKIVLLYTIFGGLWILISDRILALMIEDSQVLTQLQTYKGWLFVVVTAVLLYWLVSRYIKERRLAEEALIESEKKFRTLAENSRDMIYRMTLPDGKYEYVSPASKALSGYSPEEFYESPVLIQKIIHPNWQGYFKEQWGNLIAGRMPSFYEYQIIHKSGEMRWLHQRNALIKDNAGRPVAIEGVVSDVTERKKTEEALCESEERYRNLLDVAPVGIAVHSEGKIVFTNPAGQKLLGAESHEQLIGKPITEIIHPDGYEKARDRIQRMMAGEKGLYPAEDVYLRLDGTPIDVGVMASLLTFKGKPAVQVIVMDITERKRAEENL